jgi:GNAT superfamily N-acetyltransferase
MDWWVWQHRQNPAGEAIITVAEAEDEHNIIGHECLLPLRIKIGSGTYLIANSIDSMVHPEFRGFGIYRQIIQKSIENTKRNAILFTYNFPNKIAYRANKNIGVKPIFKKTPLWVKPLHLRNIASRYTGKNGMGTQLLTVIGKGFLGMLDKSRNYQIHTDIREVKEIDDRFDNLWQQASPHHRIILVRDKAYLDWRYAKKPDADYIIYVSEQGNRLLGYIVLRDIEDKDLKIGWIADILTRHKDTPALMDLVTKAILHFRTQGSDMVLCVMPPRAYLVPSLQKHGFIFISKWRRRISTVRIRESVPNNDKLQLYNSNDWFLTWGDSDLI